MFFRRLVLFLPAFAVMPCIAFADPTGRYVVHGTNPSDGSNYTGQAEVSRSGAAYAVKWTIAGAQVVGVGIEGQPSNSSDTRFVVGFGSGDSMGIVEYVLQPDKSWKGRWAFNGDQRLGEETWTPEGAETSSSDEDAPSPARRQSDSP
ncbi:hypothetical protein LJR030_004464 [Rhizobium sp. LjRoot30]|uniref:hypothetical protein n=1 Tax=Rhizobium sp. LjRoot30 TaxID=3342320 RepID=UPI003ECF5607